MPSIQDVQRQLREAEIKASRQADQAALAQQAATQATAQLQITTGQLMDLAGTIDAQPAGSVPGPVSAKLEAIRQARGEEPVE